MIKVIFTSDDDLIDNTHLKDINVYDMRKHVAEEIPGCTVWMHKAKRGKPRVIKSRYLRAQEALELYENACVESVKKEE